MTEDTTIDPSRYVVGRRAVFESLASTAALEKIFLAYGLDDAPLAAIRTEAKKRGVTCSVMDRRKFTALEKALGLEPNAAQGVMALRPIRPLTQLDDLLDTSTDPAPLLVALDGITDPHNLGAIARSAEAAGARGLILPVKFSAPVTAAAVKASAGALEHIAVARVARIGETLDLAKSRGFRAIGTAVPATAQYDEADYSGPLIIVIGSEGEGLHPRIMAACDVLVEIPMSGRVASLNASVAAGIVLFEARKRRL